MSGNRFNNNNIKGKIKMIITTKTHAFFYTEWPSNFCKTKFSWNKFGETHEFFCTEQAFMWAKAKFFGDEETANAILSEKSDPMTCKSLGRMVKNYDDKKWDAIRYQMFLEPNLERFRQDKALHDKLMDPKYDGLTFVEASPFDRIWGCGLSMSTKIEDLDNEKKWSGQNLLGKVITECRFIIKNSKSK